MSSDSDSDSGSPKVPRFSLAGAPAAPSYDEEEATIHRFLKVTFVLPDKEIVLDNVSDGNTIFNLQKILYDNHFASTVDSLDKVIIKHDNKVMVGPLSLNDIFKDLSGELKLQVALA